MSDGLSQGELKTPKLFVEKFRAGLEMLTEQSLHQDMNNGKEEQGSLEGKKEGGESKSDKKREIEGRESRLVVCSVFCSSLNYEQARAVRRSSTDMRTMLEGWIAAYRRKPQKGSLFRSLPLL
jgi:hypothetical protein